MIVQNDVETIKNLQNILEMTDIVILYDMNLGVIKWVGFLKDLPFVYLHRKIVNIFSYQINISNMLGTTVYII